MNYLPDAALFLLIFVALIVAGWCFSLPQKSSFEAAFVPAAAILGVYAWLVWLVGLWKLVPLFWICLPWPCLAVLVVWKRRNLAFHARRAFVSLRQLRGINGVLALYLVSLCALAFLLSLAPPSGGDYDSLTYHLAVPAQYLRAGRVVELPYDHHSYFPLTLEMLYSLALAARGAVFAKLFHWLMLPLGALSLVALGKRAHSLRAGLLAAALYASMPMVLQEATTAYIDLGFAAFAFLSILCFCGAPSSQNGENWAWSGLFCGLCLGTKYFGWLIFGFLGVSLFLQMRQSSQISKTRQFAFFAVPALLLGGFWYARNFVLVRNPVFPFAYGVLGGAGWTAQMARDYDNSQAIYGFGKSLSDLVFLPWRLAMTPLNVGIFANQVKGQPFWPLLLQPVAAGHEGLFEVQGLFVNIFPGPALFALGIPALFAPKKPREIALCSAFFAFLWVFWALTSQQIRYLLPALGMLALIGGWGAAHFAPRFRISRGIGALFLGLWLLFAPALTLWRARSTFPVLSGAITGENYLRRTFSAYSAMDYANTSTPPSAKFAVFGEPRCFYLQRAYFWADDAHNNLLDFASMRSGADFARGLRDLGATYVLWNTEPGGNGGVFGPPQPLMDDAIRDEKLILQFEARGYRIYRIAF